MKFNNILLICCVFILCACASGFPKGKKNIKEKREWEAFVNTPKSDSAIKKYWIEHVDDDWSTFKNKGSSITEVDVPSLKLINSLCYTIDSNNLLNYKKGIDIRAMLKIDKKNIVVYLVKNDSVQGIIFPAFEQNKWVNGGGYGVPFPSVVKTVYGIYKANGEVFNISVSAFPSSKTILRKYIITYKKGRFYSIDYNGNLKPFEDELISLKEYAKKYLGN